MPFSLRCSRRRTQPISADPQSMEDSTPPIFVQEPTSSDKSDSGQARARVSDTSTPAVNQEDPLPPYSFRPSILDDARHDPPPPFTQGGPRMPVPHHSLPPATRAGYGLSTLSSSDSDSESRKAKKKMQKKAKKLEKKPSTPPSMVLNSGNTFNSRIQNVSNGHGKHRKPDVFASSLVYPDRLGSAAMMSPPWTGRSPSMPYGVGPLPRMPTMGAGTSKQFKRCHGRKSSISSSSSSSSSSDDSDSSDSDAEQTKKILKKVEKLKKGGLREAVQARQSVHRMPLDSEWNPHGMPPGSQFTENIMKTVNAGLTAPAGPQDSKKTKKAKSKSRSNTDSTNTADHAWLGVPPPVPGLGAAYYPGTFPQFYPPQPLYPSWDPRTSAAPSISYNTSSFGTSNHTFDGYPAFTGATSTDSKGGSSPTAPASSKCSSRCASKRKASKSKPDSTTEVREGFSRTSL